MRPPIATHGTLLSACLLLGSLSRWVSAYQLTSQYLGAAPSHDNEHLLLFKLPESISSQLLESSAQFQQQQQQQQSQQRHQQQNALTTATTEHLGLLTSGYSLQPAGQLARDTRPQIEFGPPVAQEHAVSLTIPLLPTLQAAGVEPLGQQSINGGGADLTAQQLQAQQQSQVALESALAEYLNAHNDQQQQPYNQQDPAVGQVETSPYREHYPTLSSERYSNTSLAALSEELAATRQLALSLASHQHQQNDQMAAASQHFLNSQLMSLADSQAKVNQEPRLWRDTQLSAYPVQVSPSPTVPSPQHNKTASDFPSLVAKLANSSPDLLVRLRNLLKRTTSSSGRLGSPTAPKATSASIYEHLKPSASSETLRPLESDLKQVSSEVHENDYLMANNVGPRELRQLIQNYLDTKQPGASLGGEGDDLLQNSLKAFLSNSNVSSHEEIKIPLILIAMPRIHSYRKNHTDLSSPSSHANNATIGLPQISAALAQRLVAQLPRLLAGNLTQNSTHLMGNSSHLEVYQPARATGRVNTTEQAHLYWSGQESQGQSNSYNGNSNNYVQVIATTPSPSHTMAPYAQQFFTPRLASAPLIRQFIPMLTRSIDAPPALVTNHRAPSVVKQLLSHATANTNGTNEAYAGGASGSNTTGNDGYHQQRPSPSSNLGIQIQLVAQNQLPGGGQQLRHQQLPPFYDVQQTIERAHEPQERQQMIYLAPSPQRRSVSSTFGQSLMKDTNREHVAPMRPPYDQITRSQNYYSAQEQQRIQPNIGNLIKDPMAASLSLVEEQVSKLRPLFQANKRLASVSSPSGESKISPSQLLSLFSRSTARRSKTSRDQGTNGEQYAKSRISQTRDLSNNGPGKLDTKAKMVLMIV